MGGWTCLSRSFALAGAVGSALWDGWCFRSGRALKQRLCIFYALHWMFVVCTLVCELAPMQSLFIPFPTIITYCDYPARRQPLLGVLSVFVFSSSLTQTSEQTTRRLVRHRVYAAIIFALIQGWNGCAICAILRQRHLSAPSCAMLRKLRHSQYLAPLCTKL
uniref:Uncharacterized protein n=1 Tax=Ixodes ricinus TaxID=34613 RepID=A0A6B0UXI8_IXORI